jgi:hypothetical protein
MHRGALAALRTSPMKREPREPYSTTKLGLDGDSCCPVHPDARCAYCTVCARHHCLARTEGGSYCLRQTVYRTDSTRSRKHVMISHHREQMGANGWFLSPVRASSRLSTASSRASTPFERGHAPIGEGPAFDECCLVCQHSARSLRIPAVADPPETFGARWDTRTAFDSPITDASTRAVAEAETKGFAPVSNAAIHSYPNCPTCRCVGPSMCFVHMNSTWAHADQYAQPLTQRQHVRSEDGGSAYCFGWLWPVACGVHYALCIHGSMGTAARYWPVLSPCSLSRATCSMAPFRSWPGF